MIDTRTLPLLIALATIASQAAAEDKGNTTTTSDQVIEIIVPVQLKLVVPGDRRLGVECKLLDQNGAELVQPGYDYGPQYTPTHVPARPLRGHSPWKSWASGDLTEQWKVRITVDRANVPKVEKCRCALVMNGQGDSVREFNGRPKPGIQVKILTEKPLKAR